MYNAKKRDNTHADNARGRPEKTIYAASASKSVIRVKNHTRPTLDATLFNAEHEYGTALDHRPAFRIV